jgi:hypothetical protein
MKMLDLCSGTKSASAAFLDAGWEVVTLDNEPGNNPDILRDVRDWLPILSDHKYDFIWASPPCTEFAREFMPWSKTGKEPDMSIVNACIRTIKRLKPEYWCIENVRGAIPYFREPLGKPRAIIGAFHFWGNFPPLPHVRITWRKKETMSSSWDAQRGAIPYSISLAFYLAITRQKRLM